MLAALGVAGVGGWYLQHHSVSVSPPPAGPWPEGGTFTAFICMDINKSNGCHGRAGTEEEKRAIEVRLRAMPEVVDVTFESRTEAWEKFRKENADNAILLSAVAFEDMPESFSGRLHRRADFEPFESVLRKTAGISNIFTFGRDFWTGKADVTVMLCGPEQPSDPCSRPATAEQKEAVEIRLSALEGVEQVYFEDVAHAIRALKYSGARPFVVLSKDSVPENYRVKLADPGAGQVVIDAVKGMPGVDYAQVIDIG
ncbi:permease-like cell division protein FtsX [Streptosporangium subroseum]|uniref:permease-like cell division protein FtsX n=1 Tax=Streptosporangium subroseum TaxID=106412 RepID=UPI00309018AF|nr:permease-like cell division protein FtsX [Streptosporangium subroseum]